MKKILIITIIILTIILQIANASSIYSSDVRGVSIVEKNDVSSIEQVENNTGVELPSIQIPDNVQAIGSIENVIFGCIQTVLIVIMYAVLIYAILTYIIKRKKIKKEIENEEERKTHLKKNFSKFIKLIVLGILLLAIRNVIDIVVCPIAKPIIYIYPENEQKVTVKLLNEENITHSYPKYVDEWNVLAKPNGDLVDLDTGRILYALYWEGKDIENRVQKEGFIVKGEETISFLEEKLAILGLTEREANEFIIYWLPKLENNKYNYIRFQTIEEINEYMPLEITPTPDTLIRVIMEYKPLNRKIKVNEQILTTPKRNGFVVVEWGGTEI